MDTSQGAVAPGEYSKCLQASFCESDMALNPSKSVAILFGTPQRFKSVSVTLSDKVKILGVTLDSNLTMDITLMHYLSTTA